MNGEGLHVMKGGGTSLANEDRLANFVDVALMDPRRRLIVPSAPGKLPGEEKLTDLLINAAKDKSVRDENVRRIIDRFRPIYHAAGLSDQEAEESRRALEQNLTEYDNTGNLAVVARLGEFMNAGPVAGMFRKKGKTSTVLYPENIGMVMDTSTGRIIEGAYPIMRGHIKEALARFDIVVVPGFYAVDASGKIVTFPRGGTDTSGAVVARAGRADLYENFTDVPKIYSGDPKIIPLKEMVGHDGLSFMEVIEMSYMGAEVIHHQAVGVCMDRNIPIRVRNTFDPSNIGTLISSDTDSKTVKGVTYKSGFHMIDVFDHRMIDRPGYASEVLNILRNAGIPVEHITTSIASVSVSIEEKLLPDGMDINYAVRKIDEAIQPKDVRAKSYDGMVCVVGEGMKHSRGILSRASTALAREGININTIYQGPSENNIIFGVTNDYVADAARALHTEFFNKPLLRKVAHFFYMRI